MTKALCTIAAMIAVIALGCSSEPTTSPGSSDALLGTGGSGTRVDAAGDGGACCLVDGSCSILTETECTESGGTYQGQGVLCDPNPCPQPAATGACCFDDGSCAVTTEADCGGAYLGDGTVCDPNPCGSDEDQYEGCGLGFWKNHTDAWEPTGHGTSDEVSSIFEVPEELGDFGSDSLMEALKYGGGSGAEGAAKLLLRTAVTAALNAAHPDVNYGLAEAEIVEIVNGALASGNRREMQDARHAVGESNGGSCPLE
ncbi:MAG: hypothetical protein R3E97_18485 [Candidatus Eisenbacteria bacterium]